MDSTPAPSINWSSPNLKSEWRKFKRHYELMFSGLLSGKSDAVKCSYLLIWTGEKGQDVFSTWTLTDAEANKPKVYLNKFENYIQPSANPIFAKYIFHQRNQADGEIIESYVTQLKVLAKDCEFDTLEDQLVRGWLVFGVKNARIRERLLSEGATLTLARAIECSRAIETVQETQALMLNEQAHIPIKQEVEVVQRQKNSPACYFCAGPYSRSHKCPAKGNQCSKCRKINHFAKMRKSKVVHELETRSEVEDGREFMIESISTEEKVEKPYALIKLTENESELAFKIDTDAKANILPLKDFNKLARKPALLPTADMLTSYTGEQLKVLGTANLKVQYKNQTPQIHTFHVVCTDRAPILSRQSSERLQLIKFVLSVSKPAPIRPVIQKLLNEFSVVFEGIGTLPGTCKIYLKEGAIPTMQPPKRVPFALQAKFKEELDRLGSLGVIEKVTKPTQ
ncbi:uncharacterized protein LOC136025782 [Artemia franciscana]|uniref:uncharacterized protein LOC136025782 n=1 Tax=Artemia franciscana TaxID=6661 RepID=UPI0032DBA4F4